MISTILREFKMKKLVKITTAAILFSLIISKNPNKKILRQLKLRLMKKNILI